MEHVKNFLTGLVLMALVISAAVGAVKYFTIVAGVTLLATAIAIIYAVGWAYRGGNKNEH